MNANEQPGNHTPDFTTTSGPAAPNEEPTVILPSGQYGGYTGADFPAPAGVPPLTPNRLRTDHGSAAAETQNRCLDRRCGDSRPCWVPVPALARTPSCSTDRPPRR